MNRTLETAMSAVLVLAAVAIAAVVVKREFAGNSAAEPRDIVAVDNWRDIVKLGRAGGKADAPVTIIEFADFECPFCKRYHEILKAVRDSHPGDVSVVLVHFPLSNHRFAVPAAVASECGHQQQRFWEMVDVLYAKQDSFGLVPWTRFGTDAGVKDGPGFASCLQDSLARRPVEQGRELAERLGVDGTPTILVNEWQFPTPPSAAELERAIRSVKAGKKPTRP